MANVATDCSYKCCLLQIWYFLLMSNISTKFVFAVVADKYVYDNGATWLNKGMLWYVSPVANPDQEVRSSDSAFQLPCC
jgi:hypothetical protein